MTATKWERHYTGIEIAQGRHLYRQRDSKTKDLQFVRLSGYHWMVGVFLRRTNHLNQPGIELFTSDLHAGWTRQAGFGIKWSGSAVDPWATYTLRLGRFFIGSTTDKWLKRIMRWRENRRWANFCPPDCDYDDRS